MDSEEHPPLRVLVVDDDPLQRRLAARVVTALGHEATVAADGREALALHERTPFDVLLLDLEMPVLDGLSCARELRRREPPDRRAFLVAVTAHRDEETRRRCRDAGMDAFLPKPIRPEELRRALEPALRRA